MTTAETAKHTIYGLESHSVYIKPFDDLRNILVFDERPIAFSWNFDEEPLDTLLQAIISDKIFAIRWEQYFKIEGRRPGYDKKYLLDQEQIKIVDSDSIDSMNGFVKAGLPSGLAAFLTVLSLDQDDPLTIETVSKIMETGAVIQMDSTTYESTLEIISILFRQWERKTIFDILGTFGGTLKQQQKMFDALSLVPAEVTSSVSEPNPATLYFLIKFAEVLQRLDYSPSYYGVLISMLNHIDSNSALKVEKIQHSWDEYLSKVSIAKKKSAPLSHREKSSQDKAFAKFLDSSEITDDTVERFSSESINQSAEDLWVSISKAEKYNYGSYIPETLKQYRSFLFASIVCAYGWENIMTSIEDHKELKYLNIFHYLSLFEYEMDGSTAEPHLLFSLLDLPEID